MPAASLVDKGKPDVSRGRKATGPMRSAGLPNRKNRSCASPPSSSSLPAIEMSILVAYASRHGATGEIAERIAQGLRAAGQPADARPVQEAGDLADYEGFVVGGAVYWTHWLKDARAFARRNRDLLAATRGAGDLGVKAKKALNVMKAQRNAARDGLRAFKALGLSPEQIAALTKKLEGDGPDIDAIKATATREANTLAGFRHVTCAGGQLHICDSGRPHDE
jgi:menaquinone-dependent protoporphyrinogen IX oxidase